MLHEQRFVLVGRNYPLPALLQGMHQQHSVLQPLSLPALRFRQLPVPDRDNVLVSPPFCLFPQSHRLVERGLSAPPCLRSGYHQLAKHLINVDYCRKLRLSRS